jgi:hypothetical protein
MRLLIAQTRWGHLWLIKSRYMLPGHAALMGSNQHTRRLHPGWR